MKLIDRYILREMFVPFLIGQAAIVMMLIGTVLYNNANVLLQNQVPLEFVVRMALYFAPFLVHMTMPVAMAVAASLAVSRLGRDSEITVMRASGVSLFRIFLPIYVLGLVVSIGDFYFGEFVVPPSIQRLNGVLGEIPSHIKRLLPQPGQWIISNDQSYALYVRQIIKQPQDIDLYGVMIVASPAATFNGSAAPFIVHADRGKFKDGTWTLEKASMLQYDLTKDSRLEMKPEEKSTFTLYTVVDPQSFQSGFLLQFPMWQMGQRSANRTFTQLGEELKKDREQKIDDPFTRLDYHFKLSVPFSCLVMAICCPPISLRFSRGGGFMGTLLSICLVFVYWNTLLLMRILGSPGAEGGAPLLAPPLAAWSQNVLFTLLGLITLRRSE